MENTPLIRDRVPWWKEENLVPTVLIANIAMNLSPSLESMLLVQKACTKPYGNGLCGDEENAQAIVADINIWRPTLCLTLPAFIILFAGYYTDRYPHTITTFIYISLYGQILRDVCNCINIVFWNWSPVTAALLQAIIPGVTGSIDLLIMACSLYVMRTSDVHKRTTRFIYIYGACNAGNLIGASVSGFISTYLSLFSGFLICVVLSVVGIILGSLFIAETCRTEVKIFEESSAIKSIFNTIKSYITIVVEKDKVSRNIVILTIIISLAGKWRYTGEDEIMYYYVRYAYGMTDIDYSYYTLFKRGIEVAGFVVCVLLFQSRMRLEDSTSLLIQLIIGTIADTCLIFAQQSWQLYLFTIFQVFEGTTTPVACSWATKYFTSEEYGKISSLIAILQTLSSVITSLYSIVYKYTFTTLPGAIYMVSLSFMLISLFCASVAAWIKRRLNVLGKSEK